MDKKKEFNEALSAIIELAGTQNNTLSPDDIHGAFAGIIDDDSMYEYIFSYLADNKIAITGYVNTSSENTVSHPSKDDELEKAYIDMYMNDLNAIEELNDAALADMISKLSVGNHEVITALTEGNLHHVIRISEKYCGHGVSKADLIQEGNLGLIEGIHTFSGNNNVDEFISYIEKCICTAIENAIDEQTGSERIGKHLADRANALDHASTELAKELGREPKLEELAEHLGLSEDEVEKVMKMSLDALTIEGEGAVSDDQIPGK